MLVSPRKNHFFINCVIAKRKRGVVLEIIQSLSDGARLLADVHHQQSVARQNIISTSLDSKLRTVTENNDLDGWLFGDNLNERLKNAKQIERSGKELQRKNTFIKKTPNIDPKNRKAPPKRASLGGQQQYYKKRSTFHRPHLQNKENEQHYYKRRVSGRARQYR